MGKKLVGVRLCIMNIRTITRPKPAITLFGCLIALFISDMYLLLPIASHLLILSKTMFDLCFDGFSISEHITGLSVRATMVEINTDTTIVTVN